MAKAKTQEQLNERITQIIVEQLGVDEREVTPSAHLIDDLGADSLDCVELLMCFEEAYEIEISDEDGEQLRTVGQIQQYLRKRVRVIA